MRSTSLRGALAVALACATFASVASAGPRPELDVTQGMRPSSAPQSRAARAAADPALTRLARVSSWDERFGLPTMLWADRTAAPSRTDATAARPTPEGAARQHLSRVAGFYRLQPSDVSAASLRAIHDIGTGGIIATFQQQVDDIPVFRDEVKVLMGRDLSLISVSGYLPSQSLLAGASARTFALTPEAAVATAFSDFAGRPTGAAALRAELPGEGGYQAIDLSAALTGLEEGVQPGSPARVRKTWFHTPDALVPAYYVEFMAPDQAYSYVVDANSGELLFRHDIMSFDIYNYRVWAEPGAVGRPYDGPQGTSASPHPTGLPDYFAPPFVASVIKSQQNGPISTNDPWLAPGSLVTTGNNVDAYADIVSPDGFSAGDVRASTTSANTFDRTYDLNQAPSVSTDQRMASITQLFYNNNFFHDWYYDAGFDEASGNGQTNNFGRGGLGNDAMRSEAQDYGGTNNANMSTPADGSPGRMQMYVFTPSGASLSIAAPPSVAGNYEVGVATGFGLQSFNLTATLIVGIDGVAPAGDGCSALTNAASVSGKIVLLDRGTCSFAVKAQTAQAAGAVGCIIIDNAANSLPPGLGGTQAGITIPVISVTQSVGNALKAELANGPFSGTMLRQASVVRDGSLDNQIVAHEWGHFISNRLVGNAAGLSTNMSGGLGEGWADFHALLMSVRAEDIGVGANANWAGVFPAGSYALYPSVGVSNAYYYGIRRVPYSTNFTKNGLTFKHIEANVALPANVPTAFGLNGANNAEVHATGEVWCTMLWECYAALLNDNVRLTFAQAQTRMKNYLVAGYKLTPNAPTLLEARDAILAAALANDPADHQLLWAAFARRGAGVGAIAPDRFSATNSGVVESFVTGGALSVVSQTLDVDLRDCDSDAFLDDGEIGHVLFTVRNSGSGPVTNGSLSVSSGNGLVLLPGGTTFPFPTLQPNQQVVIPVAVEVSGLSAVQQSAIQATITGAGLAIPGPTVSTHYSWINADEIPSAEEHVEAALPAWTFAGTPANDAQWFVAGATNSANHYFAGPDFGSTADHTLTSPPLQVGGGNFSFSFKHAHDFERDASAFYDGGVVELSTDNGANWVDIGPSMIPGYTSTLYAGAGQSPLGGRPAYGGLSAGYPAMITVNVNLSTTYANQTIRIRFRKASDVGVGAAGWRVDDLVFTGLVNTPFADLTPDVTSCAPVAVGPTAPRTLEFGITGPNPAPGATAFRFGLPNAQRAELSIFDVTGRKVATLASGERAAGWYREVWNTNDDGSAPSAGIYFARLVTANGTLGSRVVVLR